MKDGKIFLISLAGKEEEKAKTLIDNLKRNGYEEKKDYFVFNYEVVKEDIGFYDKILTQEEIESGYIEIKKEIKNPELINEIKKIDKEYFDKAFNEATKNWEWYEFDDTVRMDDAYIDVAANNELEHIYAINFNALPSINTEVKLEKLNVDKALEMTAKEVQINSIEDNIKFNKEYNNFIKEISNIISLKGDEKIGAIQNLIKNSKNEKTTEILEKFLNDCPTNEIKDFLTQTEQSLEVTM